MGWEWRLILRAATLDALEGVQDVCNLQQEFSGAEVGVEDIRTDTYLAVNQMIGVKYRGTKRPLEVKLRTSVAAASAAGQCEQYDKFRLGVNGTIEDAIRLIAERGFGSSEAVHRLREAAEVRVTKRVRRAVFRPPGYDSDVSVEQSVLKVEAVARGGGEEGWVTFAVEGTLSAIAAFLAAPGPGSSLTRLARVVNHGSGFDTGYSGFVAAIAYGVDKVPGGAGAGAAKAFSADAGAAFLLFLFLFFRSFWCGQQHRRWRGFGCIPRRRERCDVGCFHRPKGHKFSACRC